MPFESSIYEEILKDYEAIRMMHKRERELRLAQVYARDAQIEALDTNIQTTGAQSMMQILENPSAAKEIAQKMKSQIAELYAQRDARLTALGLPADYTNLQYNCKTCEDTGYVNGQLCECVRKRAARSAKFASDIAPVLEAQCFDKFDLGLFSDESRELMRENLLLAKDFVDKFGMRSENLFFYGGAGCGKTFLSSCIANALLEKQVNVVYKSAVRLFSDYLDYVFNRADAAGAKKELDRVTEAQLLIIDDLGTEAINQHTQSYLFQLINERAVRKKSTIISTNFNPEELAGIYTERISSRIFERYELVEFPAEDIRLKKRLV